MPTQSLAPLVLLAAAAVVAALPQPHVGRPRSPDGSAFSLARVFGDNMVLQQGPASANVWGWTDQGDNVTVTLTLAADGSTAWSGQASPDASGRWQVAIQPMPADFAIYSLNATSETAQASIVLQNIIYGDVWLCGGQSNMGIPVSYIFNSSDVLTASGSLPFVRFMRVAETVTSATPMDDLDPTQIGQPWSVPSNESVPNDQKNINEFSAVCWLFGADLFNGLNKQVPIGLIQSQWGGTPVQAWSSETALAKCNRSATTNTATAVPQEYRTQGLNQPSPSTPTVLFNSMISPFLPLRLKGVTWYQGEANVDGGDEWGPQFYLCAFPAMITDWRLQWKMLNMGFHFVQLAPYCNGDNYCNGSAVVKLPDPFLPTLRLTQAAALALPYVGMASAADLGDQTAPAGSIHPRNKIPVGTRLAANALALTYAVNVAYHGPYLYEAIQTGASEVTVAFQQGSLYGGIYSRSAACPGGGMEASFCTNAGFEVYGNLTEPQPQPADWHVVPAALDPTSETVLLDTTGIIDVESVRYGFADWPLMTIYNAADFPLTTFVTPVFKPSAGR